MLGNSLIARFGVGAGAFAQFTVAQSTDLATIAPAWVGAWAYVDSQRVGYMAVPMGTGDMAGIGVDWKRDPATSDPRWLMQATWSINPATGNNDASGVDDANALASYDEWVARVNGPDLLLSVGMTVRILGDIPRFVARPVYASIAAFLHVEGVPLATLLTSTILLYTPAAGNHPVKFTANGVADWSIAGPGATSLVSDAATRNARGRFITGVAAGAYFFGAKVAPDPGDAATVLRIHYVASNPNGPTGVATVVPANGDGFVFESLPTIGALDIIASGAVNSDTRSTVFTPALRVQSLRLNFASLQMYGAITAPSTDVLFGCIVHNLTAPLGHQQNAGGLIAVGCWANVSSLGNCTVGWSLITTLGKSVVTNLARITINPGGGEVQTGHNTVQGTSFNVLGSLWISAGTEYICDWQGAANSAVIATGTVLISSGLNGYGGANFGIQLKNGARVSYPDGGTPAVTGAAGDVQILNNGGPAIVLPYAALPWNDGVYSGTDTLGVGGIKVTTVPNWQAGQAIVFSFNTPAGIPGTKLSVPTATRAATQFVVNSDLATDRSTYDWATVALGTGACINKWL
jgi:hypothetical protein